MYVSRTVLSITNFTSIGCLITLLCIIGCDRPQSAGPESPKAEIAPPMVSQEMPTILVGKWCRTMELGRTGKYQYDEYQFFIDGTFDRQIRNEVLPNVIAHSGRWQLTKNTVMCSAPGFSDELIIGENATDLIDLSNRAAGAPPYKKCK